MAEIDVLMGFMYAGLIYMMWSFLYARDNPLYKIAQNMFVGLFTGYMFTVGAKTVATNFSAAITKSGDPYVIAGTIFGLLIFLRYFSKKLAFYSRFPVLIIVGTGFGVSLIATIKAQVVDQIVDTLKPLYTLDNIIIAVTVICVTFYFFFSVEHKGPLQYMTRWARYMMMVAFGASFGYGFMGRVTRVISSMETLLAFPTIYLGLIAIGIIAYDYYFRKKRKK